MKHLNRWFYAGVGIAALLLAGLVYAWTVIQAPIAASFPEWTKGQLSLTFTITMGAFCIGGYAGGRLQKRWKPKMLVWAAAVLFLVGFVIASQANSLAVLYLGFGLLAGFASGLSYNAVMSSVSCWFPDKPGLISGILLMGFGMSSFLVGKVYTAVTPTDGSDAWRTSLLVLGGVLFLVMAAAGGFVVKPEPDWEAPATASVKNTAESYEEVPTGEMLRRPSFWLFMIWATFLTAAGLAIISQGTPMALEACPELTMSTVATIVGLISVFNGLGRVLFGGLYDKIGRAKTMLFGSLLFIFAMVLLVVALTSHQLAILIAAYIMTGLGYGCVTPTNSAFVGQFYGRKNYPSNFSVVNMNILAASFGSTLAGILFDMTQSYISIILGVIILIVLGGVSSLLIHNPQTN